MARLTPMQKPWLRPFVEKQLRLASGEATNGASGAESDASTMSQPNVPEEGRFTDDGTSLTSSKSFLFNKHVQLLAVSVEMSSASSDRGTDSLQCVPKKIHVRATVSDGYVAMAATITQDALDLWKRDFQAHHGDIEALKYGLFKLTNFKLSFVQSGIKDQQVSLMVNELSFSGAGGSSVIRSPQPLCDGDLLGRLHRMFKVREQQWRSSTPPKRDIKPMTSHRQPPVARHLTEDYVATQLATQTDLSNAVTSTDRPANTKHPVIVDRNAELLHILLPRSKNPQPKQAPPGPDVLTSGSAAVRAQNAVEPVSTTLGSEPSALVVEAPPPPEQETVATSVEPSADAMRSIGTSEGGGERTSLTPQLSGLIKTVGDASEAGALLNSQPVHQALKPSGFAYRGAVSGNEPFQDTAEEQRRLLASTSCWFKPVPGKSLPEPNLPPQIIQEFLELAKKTMGIETQRPTSAEAEETVDKESSQDDAVMEDAQLTDHFDPIEEDSDENLEQASDAEIPWSSSPCPMPQPKIDDLPVPSSDARSEDSLEIIELQRVGEGLIEQQPGGPSPPPHAVADSSTISKHDLEDAHRKSLDDDDNDEDDDLAMAPLRAEQYPRAGIDNLDGTIEQRPEASDVSDGAPSSLENQQRSRQPTPLSQRRKPRDRNMSAFRKSQSSSANPSTMKEACHHDIDNSQLHQPRSGPQTSPIWNKEYANRSNGAGISPPGTTQVAKAHDHCEGSSKPFDRAYHPLSPIGDRESVEEQTQDFPSSPPQPARKRAQMGSAEGVYKRRKLSQDASGGHEPSDDFDALRRNARRAFFEDNVVLSEDQLTTEDVRYPKPMLKQSVALGGGSHHLHRTLRPLSSQTGANSLAIEDLTTSPAVVQVMASTETLFDRFRKAYPVYEGDQKHFSVVLRIIDRLRSQDKAPHKSTWDDFVIQHRRKYVPYITQCTEEGEDPLPYHRFYQDEVEEPEFRKKVLRPDVLDIYLKSSDSPLRQKGPRSPLRERSDEQHNCEGGDRVLESSAVAAVGDADGLGYQTTDGPMDITVDVDADEPSHVLPSQDSRASSGSVKKRRSLPWTGTTSTMGTGSQMSTNLRAQPDLAANLPRITSASGLTHRSPAGAQPTVISRALERPVAQSATGRAAIEHSIESASPIYSDGGRARLSNHPSSLDSQHRDRYRPSLTARSASEQRAGTSNLRPTAPATSGLQRAQKGSIANVQQHQASEKRRQIDETGEHAVEEAKLESSLDSFRKALGRTLWRRSRDAPKGSRQRVIDVLSWQFN